MRLSFRQYIVSLFEGGNIKGANGETSTPILTANRGEVTHHLVSSLHDLHNQFHEATGGHLFGKDAKSLRTGTAFSGSTSHLVDPKISDADLVKHKPTMGDVDTQVKKEHMKDLDKFIQHGHTFGKYTVVGKKKHGAEISVLAKHNGTGEHHQIDFEGVEYDKEEPTKFEQFAHSSSWEDTKNGVKGGDHKKLLNAAGGDTHKFSSIHGLKSREDTSKDAGEKDKEKIKQTLFGKGAKHDIDSFDGIAKNIRDHISPEQHKSIINKFAEGSNPGTPTAVHRLRHILSGNLSESTNEHHVAVSPMSGFSPCSHIGHQDLVDAAKSTGVKNEDIHIGISKKSDFLSPEERTEIFKKQSPKGVNVHAVTGAGETIRKAYDTIPKGKKKVLHLVGGHDRLSQLQGLKKSLEAGKIKEMEGHSFDEVHVHTPESQRRLTSNGNPTSGTNMRAALANGDEKTVKEHLGAAYTPELSKHLKSGISSGAIKLKR